MSRKLTIDEFIEKARKIHGDKYDYSKVVADCFSSKNKIPIICNNHNYEFFQQAGSHLRGCGCPICGNEKRQMIRTSLKDFLLKSFEIHGNNFSYSKVDYKGSSNKVTTICNKCGTEFQQSPSKHLSGRGCPNCKLINLSKKFRMSIETFKEKGNEIHNFRYNYDKVKFNNLHDKISIICPEHGEFLQEAQSHLLGCRCPICAKSSHLEDYVRNILNENSIMAEEQKSWDWLVYNSKQYVDFYLPDYNIIIECQGIQHFKSVDFFGGEDNLKETKLRDQNKLDLCTQHGIKILYYSNLGENFEYPYDVITDSQNLIDEIKKIGLTNQSLD